MRCPFCQWQDSKVVDSRDVDDSIRRRRECLNADCGARFTTYERLHSVALFVVKKDGRREEFSREKLLSGLRKACEKRPLEAGVIEAVAADIESALYGQNEQEVQSSVLGDLVMDRLRSLDPIAYVRFASVYRDFRDVAELQEELAALVQGGSPPAGQLPLLDDTALGSASLQLRPAAPMERTRTRRPVRPVQTPIPIPGRDDTPRGESKKRKRG